MDKTYVYDERPGFESYNMMYSGMPPMMGPYMNYNMGQTCQNNNSNLENRISKLENTVDNLQNRVSRLEGNMYPQAVDYNNYPKSTYQNSMNMM